MKIATERVSCAGFLAPDVLTPRAPRLEQQFDRRALSWSDIAAIGDERLDRGGQELEVDDGLLTACGLDEVPALAQSVVAVESPVEDAGQFDEQAGGQLRVLAAVERLREHEHEEATDEGVGGVGDARQFVGQYRQPRRQAAGPGC